MPKISVIMGVYNDEKYLPQAIDSILNQTFSDFEFIICDDCSKDSSRNIIEEYSKKDDRIVFLKNDENKGLALTLNKCIQNSRGEYIARMDSDDISLENRFLKQVKYLDDNKDVSVVGTYAYVIDEKNNIYNEFRRPMSITLKDAVRNSEFIHPSVMMRKEALLNADLYSSNSLTRRAEDYDLWCKMAIKGYKLANLPDFLFYYREGKEAYKKRKYKYRVDEFKIKKYWIKKSGLSVFNIIFAIKPLVVGLIPSKIMMMRKIK